MNGVEISVERLGLPPMLTEKIVAAGIPTAAALAAHSEAELKAFCFTLRQVQKIRSCLDVSGLALRSDDVADDSSKLETSRKTQLALIDPREAAQPAAPTLGNLIIAERPANQDLVTEAALKSASAFEGDFPASDLFDRRPPRRKNISGCHKTDDERAARAGHKGSDTSSGTPTRDDPRVAHLRETLTMGAEDVAYLYNVSKGAILDAIKRDKDAIPHFRVGDRIVKFPTRVIFAQLGLDD